MSDKQVGISGDSDLGESESGFEGSKRWRDGRLRILPGEALASRDQMQKHSRANQKRPLCPRILGLALRVGKLYSDRRSQVVQPPRYKPRVSTQSWCQR